MIVVVMGVSGSGKTTIGTALADRLGWAFVEGDDWHPPQNVAKMSAGTPLTDEDRWPWLDRLNAELRARDARGESVVVTCSALKQSYRDRLTRGLARWELVFLHGSFELLSQRIAERKHRFMPAALLQSQFDALEPPAKAIAVDVAQPQEQSVERIVAALREEK
ncbi:MAG TPA: gluconokinase [Burkholderiales bacterium]|jgi:gluconokinase|nr:gluconokinase [Burkholderiales bacterium]